MYFYMYFAYFLLVHFILISMQVALLPISSIQHFLP